jgi:hypothetical protein
LTASAALSERGYKAHKDRPIDPMSGKKFARKRPEPVSSPMNKRTGASPSCRECLTNPCLLMLPFGFAMRGGCGRVPSGA